MNANATQITTINALTPYLTPNQLSLPPTRQSAVVLKKLELTLAPYPAFFRETQANLLEEVRLTNPDIADELERALDSAQQAIELHCQGLQAVANLLNNQ
ncbi:TPA: hypothetical protein ACX6S2_003471 [Photobacterium damselae]